MRKCFVVVFVAIALLCAFAPTPAKANSIDTFVFQTCEGPVPSTCGVGGSFNNTYTWQAPSSPTPINPCSFPSVCFSIIADLAANGTDLGPTTITFEDQGAEGAGDNLFTIPALNLHSNGGPMFTGPNGTVSGLPTWLPWTPTFVTGTYGNGASFPQIGVLTISSSSAVGVVEPSGLLQTGLGLLVGLAVIAFWRRESASTTCS
jgi:hypothetical protein